jgi:L-aminopeptidase/D-esterase-like protein
VEFDFPGVEIGSAEYAAGPTGTTVISVPNGARTAVDRRGGAVGVVGGFSFNHAICLTGGSVHGMEAGGGVTAEILESWGNPTGFDRLPLVTTAVIYDFPARGNAVHPDVALGRAAYRNATAGKTSYGRVGAGVSATVGKLDTGRFEFAGQGVAFRQIGEIKILVVTIVNAVGAVFDRSGAVVRGNYDSATGERRHPVLDYELALAETEPPVIPAGNTTITAVVTNVALGDFELDQFARQVHSSMHRGIQPFHTALDGDVLFALTTDEVQLGGPASAAGTYSVNPTAVGAVASEVAWDAILRAVE